MVDEVRPASRVGRRSVVAGAAWAIPAVGVAVPAPAFAASPGFLEAIGVGSNSTTLTGFVPCGRTITYTVIGGGGGGGAASVFPGGAGDMITGTFVLDCACGGSKQVTVVAAGGGGRGQRVAQTLPSPSKAPGGGGFGKGGDSGDTANGAQWTTEYATSAGSAQNYMYGGGGGGGSAILIGTDPVIVTGGGGGGGTTRLFDSRSNTVAVVTGTGENCIGGAADPGVIDGHRAENKISLSSDTPNILNQEIIANGGSGAVGATPGAGGAVGSETYFEGSVTDPGYTPAVNAPAAVLMAGNPGTAPSATGGNGGAGVQDVVLWHGQSALSGRGIYTNQGSPGGGGGYAGGGSGGLTAGSSGSAFTGGVRRVTAMGSGGGGAGSFLKASAVTCVTGLVATGPTAPSATYPNYGRGGTGAGASNNGTAGQVGYVRLSWP